MNKKITKKMAISAITLTMLMLTTSPAYAYLDPGTGSAILQGIIGSLAAGAVVLKLYWPRFMRLLGLRKDSEKKEDVKESKDETKGM